MNSAVRALCQGFLDHLFCPLGSHGERHHLASMLFFEPQGFLQREAIRLVHFKADVGFTDPGAIFGNVQRRIFSRNLLDANCNFHLYLNFPSCREDAARIFDYCQRLNKSAALVPPKPKEFDKAYEKLAAREWLGT